MSLEMQVSAWSDVTVAYCTGRVERRSDMAPLADTIGRYAGWCKTLVVDLAPAKISDLAFLFELRQAALSARREGTEVILRLSPVRPAEALSSMMANVAGSPLFQPL